MNKTVLVSVAIVLLLAIGGGAFFVMSTRSKTSVNPNRMEGNVEVTTGATGTVEQKSLKDLLALGQSQQCTFSDPSGNAGTVYIANAKMRGDFNTTTDGKVVASHMIVDQPTAYVWMDGQTTGFKMSLDTVKQPQGKTGNVDIDKKVDYTCESWSMDPTLFTLPSTVAFSDMGSFSVPSGAMEVSGTPASSSNAEQCAACNSLPAASQAQCKQALNCN